MYTNNNKKIHDTPIWLPTSQLRVATSALSTFTSDKGGNDRYFYHFTGTFLIKYDTWKDTHVRVATPNLAGSITSSMRYSRNFGYRGNVLDHSVNTLTIAGLNSRSLIGLKLEITSGVGIGQEKTILSATEPTILDSGMVTTATNALLTDTTKRWEINQYIGYSVRVVFGTGSSQVRKVLYNDANTLYFYDPNYQQLEPWNNAVFSALAPYAAPVATAGSQSNYYIEQSVITLDSNWDIQPDDSSSYLIKGGGLFLLTSYTTAPWAVLQYYDVLSDTWTSKTHMGGLLTAALGTDFSLSLITKEDAFVSGTTTDGSTRTITDTTKTMIIDQYCNFEIRIVSGNGIGQKNRIVANGTDYFEIERPWITIPTSGSTYEVYGNTNILYLSGNNSSMLYQYSIEQDSWNIGQTIDYGQTRNMIVGYTGQESFTMTTGVRNTGGITSLDSSPTNGGSGYAVGDLFNITFGGTVGKGRVEAISVGGVVTQVSLYSAGLNYTTGIGKTTTVISGSGNAALTVNILTVGVVGRITTATSTNLYKGDTITIGGCTESLWNTTYSILAIDSTTTFDVLLSATTNAVNSFAQSTVLIVDASKNWTVGEHVGRIIKIDIAGQSPTTQLRRITANTATTITVALAITAAINGTSRYVIHNPEAFGRDRQYRLLNKLGEGRSTSGSVTTLVDSTKSWNINQWVNYKFRIHAGTGLGSEVTIISNNATTLTYATQSFIPDDTTRYEIMCTFGLVTGNVAATTLGDTTKNWTINQWAGKRVRITSGTGQCQEATIASNTATVLTFSSITAPDANSTYTILAVSYRSTGTELRWIYNNTDITTKGKYLLSSRGGNTNTFDRYNIPEDKWELSIFYTPQSELINTGSSYAYDGVNTLYFSIGLANDFIYIYSMDINTLKVEGAFQTTALQGTAHIGNLMEIVNAPDGGKFLFLAINTSRIMYKTLIY